MTSVFIKIYFESILRIAHDNLCDLIVESTNSKPMSSFGVYLATTLKIVINFGFTKPTLSLNVC